MYYFDDDAKYRRTATALVPLAPIGETRYKLTTQAWATYGQTTWTPGWLEDRLPFTAGLRYTQENKDVTCNNGEMMGALTPPMAPRSDSDDKSFSNVSGDFTVAYQATDDVNTFFRYGNGYRSGGFNGESFASDPFEEETIDQYELGVKSEWWGSRLRVNGSLCAYSYDDMQVSLIDVQAGTPTTIITNAGRAERWGAELEVLVAPIDDLIMGLSDSHIDGDFKEFPDVCGTDEPIVCLQGEDFAKRGASPDNQVNLYADYVFARPAVSEITGFVNINWQDEWYETNAWPAVVGGDPVVHPHQEVDSRALIDARLSLKEVKAGDGVMCFTLRGKNLTDEDYSTFGINFGADLRSDHPKLG